MSSRIIMKMVVDAIETDTPSVKLFTLKHPKRPILPRQTPGAHVDVHLPDGEIRQYSLCGDPDDAGVYKIAVRKESDGRGASRWLHEHLRAGDGIHVSSPRNTFQLDTQARHNIFIAGGIGITPFIPMSLASRRHGIPFTLHYCVRSLADAPLLHTVEQLSRHDTLNVWHGNASSPVRFDPKHIGVPANGMHLYCCGPQKMVDAVLDATRDWPTSHIHFEIFQAGIEEDLASDPFDILISSTAQVLHVPAHQSALDVLHRHGFTLPRSCNSGICGACECRYLSGDVIHRDRFLDPSDRKSAMTPCVSRARGIVKLDL